MIHNRTTYVKYKCRCSVCVAANSEYKKRYRPVATYRLRLDSAPLISRLERDGRLTAVSNRCLNRWTREGIELYNADRTCIKLGYHPTEIWGNQFYEGCHSE